MGKRSAGEVGSGILTHTAGLAVTADGPAGEFFRKSKLGQEQMSLAEFSKRAGKSRRLRVGRRLRHVFLGGSERAVDRHCADGDARGNCPDGISQRGVSGAG